MKWRTKWRRKCRTLTIDVRDGRPRVLYPGDCLKLTHAGTSELGENSKMVAEVMIAYVWDGRVLRRDSP